MIEPALALLPFTVLETLGLTARYERSFKLSPGSLLAQRYLLGVAVSSQRLGLMVQAARRMGMPAAAQTRFERALEGASTALYDLACAFGIAPALWQRLLRAAGPGVLGHVSAGQSRQATP